MSTVLGIERFQWLPLMLVLGLVSLPALGQPQVALSYSGGVFNIDPATLETTLLRDNGEVSTLSAPAFPETARASDLAGPRRPNSHRPRAVPGRGRDRAGRPAPVDTCRAAGPAGLAQTRGSKGHRGPCHTVR